MLEYNGAWHTSSYADRNLELSSSALSRVSQSIAAAEKVPCVWIITQFLPAQTILALTETPQGSPVCEQNYASECETTHRTV